MQERKPLIEIEQKDVQDGERVFKHVFNGGELIKTWEVMPKQNVVDNSLNVADQDKENNR